MDLGGTAQSRKTLARPRCWTILVGKRVPIDRVEVSEARRSLVLMITGDCQRDDEVARLLKASIHQLVGKNLGAGHLSTTDPWYALNHTINRTVEYPMRATYLKKAQCETIMQPFLNAGLSVSGGVGSMPRTVAWGGL
jgi:hypothetical protein